MAKLSEGHKEQARTMFEEGKKPKEIIEFFKTNYNITVGSSSLSYILHGRTGEGPKKERTKKYRTNKLPIEEDSLSKIIQDIPKILKQIAEGYKSIFSNLRMDLLKSRGEVLELKDKLEDEET